MCENVCFFNEFSKAEDIPIQQITSGINNKGRLQFQPKNFWSGAVLNSKTCNYLPRRPLKLGVCQQVVNSLVDEICNYPKLTKEEERAIVKPSPPSPSV